MRVVQRIRFLENGIHVLAVEFRRQREFGKDVREAGLRGLDLAVHGAVVRGEVIAGLVHLLHERVAVWACVRPERRLPCLVERLLRYGAARDDERVLALRDGFRDNVCGDAHLLRARQRLDGVPERALLQGVDGDLRGVRIRRVQKVVFRRVEQLVEIGIVEHGFLDLETVFAQERTYERVAVDPLVAVEFLHVLLEAQPARIEEGEADAVARELPVALGGDGLFEKREIERDAELPVDGGVFGRGERHVGKALAEHDVFHGRHLRE